MQGTNKRLEQEATYDELQTHEIQPASFQAQIKTDTNNRNSACAASELKKQFQNSMLSAQDFLFPDFPCMEGCGMKRML
jgi:hypothetical protein